MTLKQLPNLALFTFNHEKEVFLQGAVWQKQFRKGTGPAKGLIIDYVAEAKKTRHGWTRGPHGMGGIGGRQKVTLVATRRAKLQVR
jgi:hypothetical protein